VSTTDAGDASESAPGQPAWALPAVLAVTVLAGLSYWLNSGSTVEIFYAAAARTMAGSWHDFFYGAFDPAGTVSVDKLPGGLWVQALSVRAFGPHVWAVLLPQSVEGALTVPLLYRVVQRLAGPLAGMVAVVVLAASPATVTLDRGNIPDTLMILLLVLAADATVTAIRTGRLLAVVLAGLWIGLAFQAKMTEAWLVAVALGLAYLVAGPGSARRRVGCLAAMAAVAVIVSLSWMTVVTLVPEASRPFVDGSTNDSVYQQVFSYNGVSRLGQLPPDRILGQTLGTPLFAQAEPAPTWHRLLTGGYGRDAGWLLPLAVLAAAGIAVARRRLPRTDLPRAGLLLWGGWLAILAVVFTVSTAMNSYYAAALSPAVAGLVGIGAAVAWERRRQPGALLSMAAAVLVTAGYAAWLLPSRGDALTTSLRPAVGVIGVLAAAALALLAARARRTGQPNTGQPGTGQPGTGQPGTGQPGTGQPGTGQPEPGQPATSLRLGFVAALAAVLLVPAAGSISAVTQGLGAFDTPFQPPAATAVTRTAFGPMSSPAGLAKLESTRSGSPDLMAAQTSAVAAPYIFATGQEVLPLAGWTGTGPEPSSAAVAAMVKSRQFHVALIASPGASPATAWIAAHCLNLGKPAGVPSIVPNLKVYYCNS
jgi:4-amino-4-deoxy-L-arabinose transferase-like glycosyltransferase